MRRSSHYFFFLTKKEDTRKILGANVLFLKILFWNIFSGPMAPRRAQGAPPLAFNEKMRPQLSIIERKRIDLFLKKKTRVSRPELGVERVAKKNKTKQNKRNRNESFCKSNSSGRTAGAKDARDARTDSPETTTNHVKTVVLRFFLFFPRIHAWFDMATGKGSPSNKTTPLYTHTHTHTHTEHISEKRKR